MVVNPKTHGKVRICVELSVLNHFVQRENHPLPSVDHTPGKDHFSKLDANSGFRQIKLAEDSSGLTTFITPWRRYYFNVLPYGISLGWEKFQKSLSQSRRARRSPVQHWWCISARTNSESARRQIEQSSTKTFRRRCNPQCSKMWFNTTTIKFLGHIISPQGIRFSL